MATTVPSRTSSRRSSTAAPLYGFLRNSQLKAKAILADTVNYGPQSVKVRHVRGINVLYASGMAQWVELKAFEHKDSPLTDPWYKIPPGIGTDLNSTAAKYNDALLNEAGNQKTNFQPCGVWYDLDLQSR